MATRLHKEGYGQLELNQVAFRRSGRIEAQCRIADGIDYIENGMLLAVNNMNRTVGYAENDVYPIALHYSTEHMYDERAKGLKNFKLDKDTFLPRMGYLGAGDKYTTNTVEYEGYDSDDAFLAAVGTTVLYAHAGANGYHLVNDNKDGAVALAIAATTMPDGQNAVKFQAL
jgi:hypothetical protein